MQEPARDDQQAATVTVSEDWTPEQVAEFQEAWDTLAIQHHVRWLPAPRPQLIVLHYQWAGDSASARQETYGPWAVADDESHLEQIQAFMRDWRRLSGCEPSSVTMALVTDPACWIRDREQQEGSDGGN